MIYTLSMRAKTRIEYRNSGESVNYSDVVSNVSGAKLVDVFDRGRCAHVEIEEKRLAELEEAVGEKFIVSRNIPLKLL